MEVTAKYEDLMKERWLRQRDNGEIQWETKDGRRIPIKDMSDEHLENTIKLLEEIESKASILEDIGGWDDPNY